jgi:Ca2+-transporting ATPase
MVYAGTHVTAGRARAVVVATGRATEIGHIAALANVAEELETPLERRIAQFGRYIIVAAAAMFIVVNAVGLSRGIPLDQILMVGIGQLVGMVPEGLPVAMTIALAVGVQRMARRNAVVRRLAAVETLGSTTVICSDKTGTLTRNEMTVTALYLPDGRELSVTGAGYEPEGSFLEDGLEIDPTRDDRLRALLEAGALCNDAQLRGPEGAEPRWKPIGDPTEVALLTLAIKGGSVPDQLRASSPRRAEIPFDPGAKMMATQHGAPEDSRVVIKGAPEVVLDLCSLDDAAQLATRAVAERMGARALRVLAVAVVSDAAIDGRVGFDAFRGRAVLLGLVGQIDPPRKEVKDAVARCRAAGIRPVMVTGDHQATGRAIARELGIARDGDLIMEPAEGGEMRRKPILRNEPPLTRLLLSRMAFMTPAIVTSTLGWFVYRLSLGVPFSQVRTETFTVLAVCQWFNVLNCRSERRSALNLSLLINPWLVGGLVVSNLLQVAVVFLPPLNRVFHTVPFSPTEVVAIGVAASLVLWVEELRKLVVRSRERRLARAGWQSA